MNKIKIFLVAILFQIVSTGAIAQQVPDTGINFVVKHPMYEKGKGTVITLDEAHYNFHTLDGRYKPFGMLLQKDGYVLQSGREKFSSASVSGMKILVIANALADTGEWKLPAKPAFTKEEVAVIHDWVMQGGSLFLIADHMPFPGAASTLALSFDFNFINGFALRADEQMEEFFSKKENNLSPGIITNGRNDSEKIDSIMVFTGQGFIAPKNATPITTLDSRYKIYFPEVAWEISDKTPVMAATGLVNGAYMPYGKGRVVMFGEAAMFSAQLAGDTKYKMGMNNPRALQNQQLLLNIIHWLDKKL